MLYDSIFRGFSWGTDINNMISRFIRIVDNEISLKIHNFTQISQISSLMKFIYYMLKCTRLPTEND